MNITQYSCIFEGNKYSIHVASYDTYLQPTSITVLHKKECVQVFVYKHVGKTIVSYTTDMIHPDVVIVLYAFLKYSASPFPDDIALSVHLLTVQFQLEQTSQTDGIVFTTAMYTFRAVIKEEQYHYSVKVGGKEFIGCIELIISKPTHPYYKSPKLAQVYSEPECWYQLGKKGRVVDMMKGSLQLCQMLFGVNTFSFEDNSNIECGTTDRSKPAPRKLEKPFSITHLSIAEKGKTWYEIQFQAFLQDTSRRNAYKNAINRLYDPSVKRMDDFEAFSATNYLRKDQYEYLKPIYETTSTWRDFFDRIPKDKHCAMLFNWLPAYMDKEILKFNPRKYEWCICLKPLGIHTLEESCVEHMEFRTGMVIQMEPSEVGRWGGGSKRGRTRRGDGRSYGKTRKQKTVLFSFSNQY